MKALAALILSDYLRSASPAEQQRLFREYREASRGYWKAKADYYRSFDR